MAYAEPKKWYESTTIWINAAGILLIVLQVVLQTNIGIDPDVQAIILAVINILNRIRGSKPAQPIEKSLI